LTPSRRAGHSPLPRTRVGGQPRRFSSRFGQRSGDPRGRSPQRWPTSTLTFPRLFSRRPRLRDLCRARGTCASSHLPRAQVFGLSGGLQALMCTRPLLLNDLTRALLELGPSAQIQLRQLPPALWVHQPCFRAHQKLTARDRYLATGRSFPMDRSPAILQACKSSQRGKSGH
jgi:hypothetical protein